MGYKGVVTVKIDFAQLTPGGRAGIECIGNKFVGGGIIMEDKDGTATPRLYMETDGTAKTTSFNISSVMNKGIYIRLEIDAVNNKHKFYYSVNNETFIEFGDTFDPVQATGKAAVSACTATIRRRPPARLISMSLLICSTAPVGLRPPRQNKKT